MTRYVLFRRRIVWLPTVWGSTLIALLILISFIFCIRNLALFLAYQQPVGSGYLVVEGWLSNNGFDQALKQYRRGNYELLITTGGPIARYSSGDKYQNYAQRAAAYFADHGVEQASLYVVPVPESAQNRTFLSAVMVREWFAANSIVAKQLDVFTGDVHSRRSFEMYSAAFDSNVELGVLAAKPDRFMLDSWWRTSDGAKTVVSNLSVGYG